MFISKMVSQFLNWYSVVVFSFDIILKGKGFCSLFMKSLFYTIKYTHFLTCSTFADIWQIRQYQII